MRISSLAGLCLQHYAPAAGGPDAPPLDVTFTATTSASGSLLLGSSRELAGFDARPDHTVASAILARATQYLPELEGIDAADASSVRVGLRPYAGRGMPYIGEVPGVPGLYIAAGHEGSGLTLGPATGEILSAMVLGLECSLLQLAEPFAVH